MPADLIGVSIYLFGTDSTEGPLQVALLLSAAVAALVLFLLFPRVHGPLWGLPQDAYAGMTGLSDTMTPGALSQLARSDALAYRAEFEGEPPPQAQRYWRGPVLWDFDGRTWRIGTRYLAAFSAPPGGSTRYRYDVVLEPHNRHWLFALETAASLPARTRMQAGRTPVAWKCPNALPFSSMPSCTPIRRSRPWWSASRPRRAIPMGRFARWCSTAGTTLIGARW